MNKKKLVVTARLVTYEGIYDKNLNVCQNVPVPSVP